MTTRREELLNQLLCKLNKKKSVDDILDEINTIDKKISKFQNKYRNGLYFEFNCVNNNFTIENIKDYIEMYNGIKILRVQVILKMNLFLNEVRVKTSPIINENFIDMKVYNDVDSVNDNVFYPHSITKYFSSEVRKYLRENNIKIRVHEDHNSSMDLPITIIRKDLKVPVTTVIQK